MRDLLVVIVADPGFEQISQNIQRICAADVGFQETKKTPGGFRAFVGQMQVGDKKCAAGGLHATQTISALVMITSSSGTS